MNTNKLKKNRKAQGMTLNKLSELSGVSMWYICHLEKGTRKNPSKETMEKIAKALDKSVIEIFF